MRLQKLGKKKIIFLDFDGVLNSTRYHEKRGMLSFDEKKQEVEWYAQGIDPEAVVLLNEIIERTGAKVVISSAWRCGTKLDFLRKVLELRGFKGEIVGKTPYFLGEPRCHEIREYFVTHIQHITPDYVILDDDYDAGIQGHFVMTDFRVGLTKKDVDKAVDILGEVF